MLTNEEYMAMHLEKADERITEQERAISDLEDALNDTAGVLTDLLLAYEEFCSNVENLVREYKTRAYQSDTLYTLEETKVGEPR